MTQITVDTSQFTKKIADDVVVGFGGVPMTARCPDPYALALADEISDEATTAQQGREQIRGFLTHVLGSEQAGRVEAMMADPENEDVTLISVRGLIEYLMGGEGGPKWRDAITAATEGMAAAPQNRTQRRLAAKKTTAAAPAGVMKKVPAKKTAAKKTAARRATK